MLGISLRLNEGIREGFSEEASALWIKIKERVKALDINFTSVNWLGEMAEKYANITKSPPT